MATERAMATSQITIDALAGRIGQELVMSEWVQVKQQRIDDFAEVIGDEQWIHVDPLRAAAESPYETTVAHGFLLLSLIGHMLRHGIEVVDSPMAIDYGLEPRAIHGTRARRRRGPRSVRRQGGERGAAVGSW